jgi:hypothetical protein
VKSQRARLRQAVDHFVDELADILGLPADEQPAPAVAPAPRRRLEAVPRAPKARVVQLHPGKDTSDVPETTRQRARSLLRKNGIRTQGDR